MYSLNCTIAEDQTEIAYAIGYEHGMDGCVEEQFGRQVRLACYFGDENDAKFVAKSFKESLLIDNFAIEFIPDNQDWNAKWRESMEPAEIAAGVWVSPEWLEPPAEGRKVWIKIEPKMAFGTGHHETTRLAAQNLMEQKRRVAGKSVLDIGTGSGVLCFAADYLGAKSALGVEIDGVCRENLAENLRNNPPRSKGRIDFVIGTLDAINAKHEKFDVVVMNMLPAESVPLLAQIKQLMKTGGLLIWSGILDDEEAEITGIAEDSGFEFIGLKVENEWWSGKFLSR